MGTTRAGVNGLFDMGAMSGNGPVTDHGQSAATMGGSWWYGNAQMTADYGATKPRDMAAIYIGFRCIGRVSVFFMVRHDLFFGKMALSERVEQSL